MRCEEARDNFADYLKENVDGAFPPSVSEHLAGCVSCREELAQLRATWRDMDLVLQHAPPHDAMRAWLNSTIVSFQPRRAWAAGPRRRALQLVFAMGLLVACVFAAQQSGLLVAFHESLSPQAAINKSPSISPNGAIEGVVVMRGAATPIAGAQVVLLEGGNHRADAVTNSQGHFMFGNVTPGAYEVHAFGDGLFGNPDERAVFPEFGSVPVTVVAQQAVPPVHVSLVRGGSISGKARDANGQPIDRANMRLFEVAYSDGFRSLKTIQNSTVGANGTYRFSQLPPGDYYVAIATGTNAAMYYPGTLDQTAAKPITLHQGATLTNINVAFSYSDGVTLSGRVVYSPRLTPMPAIDSFNLSPPRTPVNVAGRAVLVYSSTDALASTTGRYPNVATDQSNGQFEIQGVLPGIYDLSPGISISYPNTLTAGTRIEVRERDIRDVHIAVGPLVNFPGKVSASNNGESLPLELLKLDIKAGDYRPANQLFITDGNTNVLQGLFSVRQASVLSSVVAKQVDAATGEFIASLLPGGKYRLIASGLPPNAYIADIRQSGQSVFDDGFTVDSESGNSLEVIVDLHGATLKGVVVTPNQTPEQMGVVALIPLNRRQNMALYKNAILRSGAVTKSDGQFSITGIAPGDYKIFAWENVPPDAWKDAGFMKRYETRGKRITIGQGAIVSTRVTLIPWEP